MQALLALNYRADPAGRRRPTRRSSTSASSAPWTRCSATTTPTCCWSATTPTSPPHVERARHGDDRRVGVIALPRVHQRAVHRRSASTVYDLEDDVHAFNTHAAARADHPARRVRPRARPALTDTWTRATTTSSPRSAAPRWSGCRGCRRAPTYASGPSSRTATRPARSRTAPALRMIEEAEKDGPLRPGCTILEPTVRQHRHLAGDGGQAQGLPAGLRDAREHLRGAPPAAADVGRRDHLLARGRRLQRGGPGRQGGRGRAPRLGDALPVRQRGQRARPRGGHRPRDARRPARRSPTSSAASAPPAR